LTDAFKNYLYNNFNSSQINAIINVYLKEEGITLVHGPPGTGKTFTVAGIIATILRDREKAKTLDKKRVLVCAPSNAAVDELLLRISSNGLIDQNGRRYFPKIVRLGVKSRISEEISLLFIDNIVEKEIRNRQNNLEQNYREQYAKLSRELEITQKEIEKVRTSIQTASASNNTSKNVEAMQINLDTMNERKQTLIKQLSNLKIMNLREMQKISHQQLSIRKQIIASADIFGTTLGSITNQDLPSLSSIIIDESCQSVEPDCIAPLVYNNSCKSIALIGDPQQLPPTVLSNYLSNSNYEQSLMERLLAAGSEKIMLDIQYRMHPSIAYFPSKVFYSGKLLNGPNCGKDGDWLYKSNRSDFKIAPYQIFDLTYSKESLTKNNSIKNEAEAQYVAHLYCSIMDTIENPEKLKDSIGIISPYRQQVTEIKYWISKFSGSSTLRNVQVATVDAFQGKEKDIIIFSCVRSALGNDSSGIGFLEDVRRMNVAITRAKYVLYIVCNSYQLSKNPIWRELINDSIQHKCYQRIESPPSRLSSYSKYFILPSNSASRSESLQSRDVERKEILKPSISKATTSDEIGSSNRISSTNKELSFSSIPIPQKVATVNMEHTSNESFASNNSLISNNMKVIEINAQTSNLKPITSVMKVFDKETNSNVSLTRNKPDKEPLSNIISSSRKAPTSNNIRTSSSYKVISANKEPKTNKITAPSNCLLNKKPVETKLIDLHLSDPRFKILKQKPHVLK
jgi:senataxin